DRTRPLRSITLLVTTVMWALAVLLVFLAWNGAADRIDVWQQMPFLVSGGLGALILTMMGAAVLIFGALGDSASARQARAAPAASIPEPATDGDVRLLTRSRRTR